MRRRNRDEEEKEQPVEEAASKYQKPKVLLVDLPESCLKAVLSAGFNALPGSFGTAYRTGDEKEYGLLVNNSLLPDHAEQEIIFIDLTPPETVDVPRDDLTIPDWEERFWVRCRMGRIDPRPLIMYHIARPSFDRILEHSGIFVIFAQDRLTQEAISSKGRPVMTYRGYPALEKYDNWSFLSVLSQYHLTMQQDNGREMSVSKHVHKALPQIVRFLESSIKGARYTATFERGYKIDETNWLPILDSKFGDCVGGMMVDESSMSFILILPQIRRKEEAILALLREVLPDIAPHLFPHVEGARWVQRPEYELDSILKYKQEIIAVKQRVERELEELDRKIQKERDELGFFHGILTKTGDDLVSDVKSCLEFIGFEKVIDVDAQIRDNMEQEASQKQEDLQIRDKNPILLLEIKGISELSREAYIMQVVKYVSRRKQEWKGTDVRGVSIINHQLNLLTLERDNENVFTRQQIKDAKNNDITLLTTWDLFLLVRGMLRWGWEAKVVQELLYESGRMPRIPSNYRLIGKIGKYYPELEVISVDMSKNADCELRKGDWIGYVTDTGYLEEEVVSLQVDSEPVEKAHSGQKVGIKTEYPRDLLREGMAVYKVIK